MEHYLDGVAGIAILDDPGMEEQLSDRDPPFRVHLEQLVQHFNAGLAEPLGLLVHSTLCSGSGIHEVD